MLKKAFNVNSVGYKNWLEWLAVALAVFAVIVTVAIYTGDVKTDLQIGLTKNAAGIQSNRELSEMILTRQNNVIERLSCIENEMAVVRYIRDAGKKIKAKNNPYSSDSSILKNNSFYNFNPDTTIANFTCHDTPYIKFPL